MTTTSGIITPLIALLVWQSSSAQNDNILETGLLSHIGETLEDFPACPTPTDTLILVDSSGSISKQTFAQAKDLVIRLSTGLAKNPSSRQGVYNFGESPTVVLKLDERLALSELIARLQKDLNHTDGYTYIENGIELATSDLIASTRNAVPLNIVILSDGHFEDKDIFGDPARAAIAALEKFINIFVVAIGEDVDISELESLTDDKKQVYHLHDQVNLKLLHDICYLPLLPPSNLCQQPCDVIFVVDASGSIGLEGFNVAKDLTRRLLRGFLQNSNSRQGVIQFSSEASLIFGPTDDILPYRKDHLVKTKLLFEDEYTFTEKAISMAREILQNNDRGARRIIILLTDGQSDFPHKAIGEAHQALDLGMDIFAAKFGDGDSTELRHITDYDERVFNVGYENIPELVNSILSEVCPRPPTPPHELPLNCFTPMNMIILLESSAVMGENNFHLAKTIVRQLAKWAGREPKNRISVASFSNDVIPAFLLPEKLSIFWMDSRIRHIGFRPHPQVNTGGAVMWSIQQHEFTEENVAKRLVIVGTGHAVSLLNDKIQSLRARESGIQIFAITFGGHSGYKHLLALSGSFHNIWHRQNCDNPERITREVSSEMCPLNKTTYTSSNPCTLENDLIVVLDTSKSLNIPNYRVMKRFSSKLLSSFPSSAKSLVGLLTAGNEAKVWLGIHTNYSNNIVANMVMGIPYSGGVLHLADAIRIVRRTFYGESHRYFIPKTLLYINNEAAAYGNADFDEATLAEEQRINMVAIGIGNEIDIGGLEKVAGSAKDVFLAVNHKSLLNLLDPISRQLCKEPWIPLPPICYKSNDIVVILDASSGSGHKNFSFSKEFVARLLQVYIQGGVSRIGLITYGGTTTEVINLGAQSSIEQMQDIVLNAKFLDGPAKITTALRYAAKMISTQSREQTAATVVLVSHSVTDLNDAVLQVEVIRAQWLANTFVIAVGNQLDPVAAERLAGNTQDMHLVKDHHALFSAIVSVSAQLCKNPPSPDTIVTLCDRPNDILYLIDSSREVGLKNFASAKGFVMKMMEAYANLGNSRQGLTTYGSQYQKVVEMTEDLPLKEMQARVWRSSFLDGEPNTLEALRVARSQLPKTGNGVRLGVPKTVLMVTNSISNMAKVIEEAQAAWNDYINIFLVVIGEGISKRDAALITKDERMVYMSSSYHGLLWALRRSSQAQCREYVPEVVLIRALRTFAGGTNFCVTKTIPFVKGNYLWTSYGCSHSDASLDFKITYVDSSTFLLQSNEDDNCVAIGNICNGVVADHGRFAIRKSCDPNDPRQLFKFVRGKTAADAYSYRGWDGHCLDSGRHDVVYFHGCHYDGNQQWIILRK